MKISCYSVVFSTEVQEISDRRSDYLSNFNHSGSVRQGFVATQDGSRK